MKAPHVDPGRPFWTGFTAFFTNVVVLLGFDKIDGDGARRSLIQAMIASLFVAAALYGREKIAERRQAE